MEEGTGVRRRSVKSITQKVKVYFMKKEEGKLSKFHQIVSLFAFVGLNLVAGLLISRNFMGSIDTWYNLLDAPSFRPPNWLFAPVWTILYILIGFSAWRIYIKKAFWWSRAILYFIQLVFNFAWTPIFFGYHMLFIAIIDCAIVLALIIAMMVVFRKVDLIATIVLTPYLMWISFATALSVGYWNINFEEYGYLTKDWEN